MYHFIYQTVNKVNGKIYIGRHSTDVLEDGYLGSGRLLWYAIQKYGAANFERQILQMCGSKEESKVVERKLVTPEFVARPDTYNVAIGGAGGDTYTGRTLEEKLLHSRLARKGNLGKKLSAESKALMSKNHGLCSGKHNSRAKKYLFISPEGVEHLVHGNLMEFAWSIGFTQHYLYAYLDKGVIKIEPKKSHTAKCRITIQNITGWEVRTVN